MKQLAKKILLGLLALILLGLVIDTGSVAPPDETLVYLNPTRTTYYPPTQASVTSDFIPTSYGKAKAEGAKPYDPKGFNVDEPKLLVSILESTGLLPEMPRYWLGTRTKIRRYSSSEE